MKRTLLFAGFYVLQALLAFSTEKTLVTGPDAAAWIERVIPLPHEISISNKVGVAPADLGLKLTASAGEIERQAALELTEWMRAKTGCALQGTNWIITAGVLDAAGQVDGHAIRDAARLRTLPNAEQAYIIQPLAEGGLVIAGLSGKGVYYGVQTLRQLLGQAASSNRIDVPLAEVVDWPDFTERGLWNVPTAFTPMMSRVKLNFIRFPCRIIMDKDGRINAQVDTNFLAQARAQAVHGLVDLHHLNMWRRWGLFERYPQIVGQGPSAQNPKPKFRVPCASAPELQSIIRDWMLSAAGQGVPEVCVWVSEEYGQCECPKCRKATKAGEGQFYREYKSIHDAWQEARQQYPKLGLRVFSDMNYEAIAGYGKETKTGQQIYEDILKLLPPEVKMDICIFSAQAKTFDAHAAKGRWFASYDVRIDRFPGGFDGTRIHEKAQDIYGRKWIAQYGFGGRGLHNEAHDMQLQDYNVCALAEWTWNINGRSLHDFSRAWAIRRGYADPEKAAAWIDALEPIESGVALGAFFTRRWEVVPTLLRERKYDRITVTSGIPGAGKVAAIKKMSEQMAQPEITAETGVIVSYIALLQSLDELIRARQAADTNAASPVANLTASVTAFQTAVSNHIAAVAARADGWLLPANAKDAVTVNETYRNLMQSMATNVAAAVMETQTTPSSGNATVNHSDINPPRPVVAPGLQK